MIEPTQSTAVCVVVFLAAFLSFGAGERLREGARKPFVIRGYMFSNGVLLSEVPKLNAAGILLQFRFPQLIGSQRS